MRISEGLKKNENSPSCRNLSEGRSKSITVSISQIRLRLASHAYLMASHEEEFVMDVPLILGEARID
jgi:hypothetical protein